MKLIINNSTRKFTYRKRRYRKYIWCSSCNIKSCMYGSLSNPLLGSGHGIITDIYPDRLTHLKLCKYWRLYHETYY